MNKAQKEVQQTQLNDEKKVIKLLELVYEQAKKDCEQKIRELSARTDLENLQSIKKNISKLWLIRLNQSCMTCMKGSLQQ